MKLTRFYLRQNLEPLGNVCICVGGLPTGLESTKYQDLLSDVLGESKYPLFNPLSPNMHIQILQTDLYIFP